jgi:epoxyqueuosine reductase QueG
MKEVIHTEIKHYARRYQGLPQVTTRWQEPLVGCAAAADPLFQQFKKVATPTHYLPVDLLPGARTVIAFFLPFETSIITSNVGDRLASPAWAQAYIDTNNLLRKMGQHLQEFLENYGFAGYATPPTHNFDPEILLSDWSHRHVAYAAGLGGFGLNNMLITEKGCCGRFGSLITTLELEADPRRKEESCLFRFNGSCRKCLSHCANGSLSQSSFNRFQCHALLLENEEKHRALGTADVCGKCLVGLPCSTADPVKKMKAARNKR